jgi:hypothetical protein
MKRTSKYALSIVLGAITVLPALAQDQFPDVPENHWAYKELQKMKQEGLLVGYPDGLFRGSRPASRYELAVAIHAVWSNLKGQIDSLNSQLSDLRAKMDQAPTKADLDALRDSITALQNQTKANTDDIAALRKMVDEFSGELRRLGADVDQMKKDFAEMGKKVDWLWGHKLPFDVSGDLNLVALGGYSDKGDFGITVDGRPTGFGRGATDGVAQGATRDLTILHEGALSLTSNNDSGPKFHATMVIGNMLGTGIANSAGWAFNNQSVVTPGVPFNEGDESWYLQDFNVTFDTSIAGLGFNAALGRVGYKVSPMMFQRPDNTPYFANDRWDNGLWMIDGGILGFKFGSAKLNVFGGRNSGNTSTLGEIVQPMTAGQVGNAFSPGGAFGQGQRPRGFNSGNALMIDQSLGAHLSFPLGGNGTLNLAYLWLDSNSTIDTGTSIAPVLSNGVNVYGGDVTFNLAGLGIDAGYSKSDLRYNEHRTITEDNAAWWANVNYNRDRFGLKGGFKHIEPQYSAPGDWGRIGIWWNPTDIEGFYAKAFFDLTNTWRITAQGEFYKGTETTLNGVTGLSSDDKINRYLIGLEYKMATNYNLALGYEYVRWDLADRAGVGFTGGTPTERWINIGFGFDLSEKAKLSLLWQISDYDGKGVAGFNPFAGNGSDRARGGLITTQLSVRF